MATVSKTSPYDLWEIDAVESWLDDMATQGLLFEYMSGGKFVFREVQPQTVRHRIDLRAKKSVDTEARYEAFRDFGWEHICYINGKMDIYRAVSDDATELHTDEALLQEVNDRKLRRLKWMLVVGSVVTAFLLISFFVTLYRRGLIFTLLTQDITNLITLPLWFFVVVFGDFRLWRAYRDMRSRSLLERTYHTRQREKERRKAQRVDVAVRLTIAAVLFVGLIHPHSYALDSIPLDGCNCEPYSIEQILPQEAGDNTETRVFFKDYALSRMLLLDQYTGTGKRDYEVRVYECRNNRLASLYAAEAVKIASASSLSDSAWYYEGTPVYYPKSYHYLTDTQNLLLLDNNLVIHIGYRGSAELHTAANLK